MPRSNREKFKITVERSLHFEPRVEAIVEPLELRVLLSAAVHKLNRPWKLKNVRSYSTLELRALPVLDGIKSGTVVNTVGSGSPTAGLSPAQIRGAYQANIINFIGVVGDGTGETIAIVDPYDDPNLISSSSANYSNSDLYLFDKYYDLPNPPSFTKYGVNEPGTGQATVSSKLPATDPAGPYRLTGYYSQALEECLDVEWAHVMAPNANIVLIESDSYTDIYSAVQAANNLAGVNVISMSFSADESELGSANQENLYNLTYFNQPDITYVASDGDWGAYGSSGNGEQNKIEPQFPASSEDVLTVGGTSLSVSGSVWSSETSWGNNTSSGTSGGGGGGISLYIAKPAYQSALLGSGGNREYPDVSLDGNPSTGVSVLDSWDCGTGTGWINTTAGGTSLAAPMMAGLVAIADQGRALDGLAPLNSNGLTGGANIHSLLYTVSGSTANFNPNFDFRDITTGQPIGPPETFSPGVGYDLATGLGSPVASNLVFDLTGISSMAAVNRPAITSLYYKQDSTSTLTDVWFDSSTPGVGPMTYKFGTAYMSSILYAGTLGNDSFTLDFSSGSAFASGLSAITYSGAVAGNNSLAVVGGATAGDIITATSTNLSIGAITIAFTNATSLTLNPGNGTDSLAVNSGAWTIAPQSPGNGILIRNFSQLVVASGASLLFNTAMQHTDRTLVTCSSLAVLGQLDLGGNDMIVHSGSLAAITALLATGYHNGSWNGNGISSFTAHNDTTHTTALGVIAGSNYDGADEPQFDGTNPVPTDVLIKYTYYGDTDLNGKVDGSDYTTLDSAFLLDRNNRASHPGGTALPYTGWANGDFDYDSEVDGTDYTLIDNAFNSEGPRL